MSRDIGTYRRTMLKEAPAGTKHQSMNWNRIVSYSKRWALETVQVFVVKADFFFLTSPASLK